MVLGKDVVRFCGLIGVVAGLLAAAPVLAQTPDQSYGTPTLRTPPSIGPTSPLGLFTRRAAPFSPDMVPLLDSIQKSGGKLYYVGERSNLYGWVVIKDNQIQMIYVTPDRVTAIVGGLFTAGGDSVSTQQLAMLAETNKDVAALLNPAAAQQRDVVVAGAVVGGAASVPADPAAGRTVGNLLPAVPVSPGERLLMDMRAASGVTLGKDGAPEIFMVVDPRCNHCRGTWKELRDYVTDGKIAVRLIPTTIGSGEADDVRLSALLLQAEHPLKTWDAYVGGDKNALSGVADTLSVRAVQANRGMMDRWNIQATPYLVYRAAKDGQIKIVQGKPERMATVLMDLLKK